MTTEEGVVVEVSGRMARVRTQKTGACESCSAKSSCHVLGGGKEMEVEVVNIAAAGIGDRVLIAFETASLVKASFLIYVLPILGMMAGGFLGQGIASYLGWNSAASSIVTAFGFLGLSFVFVRAKGNRMSRKEIYQPKIIRILDRASSSGRF